MPTPKRIETHANVQDLDYAKKVARRLASKDESERQAEEAARLKMEEEQDAHKASNVGRLEEQINNVVFLLEDIQSKVTEIGINQRTLAKHLGVDLYGVEED